MQELGIAAVAIVNDDVMVVGHRARQHDVDAAVLRRLGEAVRECVVGLLVRTQQEHAQQAAARE